MEIVLYIPQNPVSNEHRAHACNDATTKQRMHDSTLYKIMNYNTGRLAIIHMFSAPSKTTSAETRWALLEKHAGTHDYDIYISQISVEFYES